MVFFGLFVSVEREISRAKNIITKIKAFNNYSESRKKVYQPTIIKIENSNLDQENIYN